MSNNRRAQQNSAKTSGQVELPLPAAIEARIEHWRDLFAQAGIAKKRDVSEKEIESRWLLGSEVIEAVATARGNQQKTVIMTALANRLGCSRPLIYDLTAVAEAFPDQPPSQHWNVIVHLAHMDGKARKQWLTTYPNQVEDGAAIRELLRDRKPRRGGQHAANTARADEILEAGLQAFDEMMPLGKWEFALQMISRLSATSLHDAIREEYLSQIERAVEALRNQVPSQAVSGTTLEGQHDKPG